MGKIIDFQVRTLHVFNRAKTSKVISLRPVSAANRTKSAQRRGGMPRSGLRQVLTVDSGTPNLLATAEVPPSLLITKSEVSITRTIVRASRTSQALSVFAECEATNGRVRDEIGFMADTLPSIARRLELTRIALGFESQVDFCKEIRVQKNIYNPFEKGKRRISLAVAMKVRRRFGVSLDWIYCGDPSSLPVHLHRKLSSLAA